jgi:hypothetical protein
MSPTEFPQRASQAVSTKLASGRGRTRRGFLLRVAAAGSAFAASPIGYLVYPDTARATNCPAPGGCSSGACTDGYSAFCCGLAGGSNNCPSGTRPGGWWWANIPTSYCANGKRYYIDCIGNCPLDCSSCRCRDNSCSNRRTCCNHGYTNCGGPPAARLRCRIVRCMNPCNLFSGCSCQAPLDQGTCSHSASCSHTAPSTC